MVHPDFFDDVRMPVLRATDRLRALAPVIEKVAWEPDTPQIEEQELVRRPRRVAEAVGRGGAGWG